MSRVLAITLLCAGWSGCPVAVELEVVRVQASQLPGQAWESAGNRSEVNAREIERTRQQHPAELFARSPGVWVSRGDGQEHLTAIRSPVLTGAGACGSFVLLENGLPIRPTGFCNQNGLFEINHEQASAVEVIRGPASALYGGNALHGVINVKSAAIDRQNSLRLGLDAGQDDYGRVRMGLNRVAGKGAWRLDYLVGRDKGWRDHSGYEQQKLTWRGRGDAGVWRIDSLLSATLLRQETAGFVFGEDAYQKAGIRRDNPNPEAYRDAWSWRWALEMGRLLEPGSADREPGWLSLTPYLRRSRMDFLQHFLPGQPREENGQQSAGVMLSAGGDWPAGHRWTWSIQGEYARGFLREFQAAPVTDASPFLIETRPPRSAL